jgi:colicin import membrane protein
VGNAPRPAKTDLSIQGSQLDPVATANSIAKRTQPSPKPTTKKYIYRPKKMGDKGFTHQQAEKAILTADHELHRINRKLRKKRQRAYSEAEGQRELHEATLAAAKATANMATAVRHNALRKVAETQQKIDKLEKENLKKPNSKTQLELARQTAKKAKRVKQARLANRAVTAALNKAGSVLGAAHANAIAKQDENTRLENAIVKSEKAKIALAYFDKHNQARDQEVSRDKETKKYYSKAKRETDKKIQTAEKEYQAKTKQDERAHEAKARAEAQAYDKQAFSKKATITSFTSKRKARRPAKVTPVFTATTARSGSKLKKAQSKIAVAHASGNVADVKKALRKITKVSSTPKRVAKKP